MFVNAFIRVPRNVGICLDKLYPWFVNVYFIRTSTAALWCHLANTVKLISLILTGFMTYVICMICIPNCVNAIMF